MDNDDAIAFFNGLTCVDYEEFSDVFFEGECFFNLSMYESIWTNSFEDVASVLARYEHVLSLLTLSTPAISSYNPAKPFV